MYEVKWENWCVVNYRPAIHKCVMFISLRIANPPHLEMQVPMQEVLIGDNTV
jgi:hypothetical protein